MNLSSMISDGMVLQRNANVTIAGKTAPNQDVQVDFLGSTHTTQSNALGDWSIILKDMEAGGPHTMVIKTPNEQTVLQDILIGDVWVLGGQSNMQMQVNRTLDLLSSEFTSVNYPYIRQFTDPEVYNFHTPQELISGGEWLSANAHNVMEFGAAGLFFAMELYERYGVPIGLVQTAIGGTPIEAWMSELSLRQIGGYEAVLEQNKDDAYVSTTIQTDEERNHDWHQRLREADRGVQEQWFSETLPTGDWRDFTLPNSWENSELEAVRGAVWFRRTFELPASMIGGSAKLSLGTIVDADETYINGVCVGTTSYRYPPRRYIVPEGLLKPGTNTIAVRVISYQTTGEFIRDMPYKLMANGQELDLQGVWKYRIGAVAEELVPQTFFQYMPSGVYNGMITPLRNYPIKGVVWYQGESNAARPAGYHDLFQTLVHDWRSNWGIGNFPFIYTQLANYGTDEVIQLTSEWAELREEQRKGLDVPNTAMAVTFDVGEYNDIHPQDKKTVGQRLARCAIKLAYGEDIVYSGPMYKRMQRDEDAIYLYFDHIGGGLIAKAGQLKGFTVCGSDGSYEPANAVIAGDHIRITHDAVKQPQHVRYAWLNDPSEANLYNKEGLPASPFTTAST